MGRRQYIKREKTPTQKELKDVQTVLNAAKLELEHVNAETIEARKEAAAAIASRDIFVKELAVAKYDTEESLKQLKQHKDLEAKHLKLASKAKLEHKKEEDRLASVRKELSEAKSSHDQVLADDIKKHTQIKNALISEAETVKEAITGLAKNKLHLVERLEELENEIEVQKGKQGVLLEEIDQLIKDRKLASDKKISMEESLKQLGDVIQEKIEEFNQAELALQDKNKQVDEIDKKHEELKAEILAKKNGLLAIVMREKKFHKTKDMLEDLLKDVGLDMKL